MAPRPALVRSLRQFTADSFSNFLVGFGTWQDKVTQQNPSLTLLSMMELEQLYRGDWIARKIVDIPAFDATRAWRQWQADKDQIEKLEECEQEIQLQQKVLLALQRARLYGGAAMVLGVIGTGEFHEELDVEKVKKGASLCTWCRAGRWQPVRVKTSRRRGLANQTTTSGPMCRWCQPR
jgi:phage-related protein (TIGR01555 family)